MNQSTQFMNKINQNTHFLTQQQQQQHQQQLANRFIGMNNINSNQYLSSSNSNNNQTNSPPLNGQLKNNSFNSSLSLGQQQSDLIQQQQRNYPIVSSNLVYPMNNINFNTQNSQQQQQLNAPTLIASVLAANTTCNLNNTLFVGNLHASLQEIDLVQVFRPFGRIVECCKKWLHFGFVKFTSEEEACHAYVTLNGFRLKGRPMRLEFQNRTKKARIKAILAQAALQASTNNMIGCNNDTMDSSLANLGFSSFLSEDTRQVMSSLQSAQMSSNNTSHFKQIESNDCSFFDSDQLIKFANSSDNSNNNMGECIDKSKYLPSSFYSDIIENNFNDKLLIDGKEHHGIGEVNVQISEDPTNKSKHISPSESPHHEFSCSLSSSDSGCRSTASFLAEEDSGIASLQLTRSTFNASSATISKVKHDSCLTEENLESFNEEMNKNKQNGNLIVKKIGTEEANIENLSLTDMDDCEESDSDTGDDASDIPDSECLDDLASLDDIDYTYGCDIEEHSKNFNQVIEKDGTILRKKLEFGIYRSINNTFSLFIEPQDVLKKVDTDDYDEYILFPNGTENIDSYFTLVM